MVMKKDHKPVSVNTC